MSHTTTTATVDGKIASVSLSEIAIDPAMNPGRNAYKSDATLIASLATAIFNRGWSTTEGMMILERIDGESFPADWHTRYANDIRVDAKLSITDANGIGSKVTIPADSRIAAFDEVIGTKKKIKYRIVDGTRRYESLLLLLAAVRNGLDFEPVTTITAMVHEPLTDRERSIIGIEANTAKGIGSLKLSWIDKLIKSRELLRAGATPVDIARALANVNDARKVSGLVMLDDKLPNVALVDTFVTDGERFPLSGIVKDIAHKLLNKKKTDYNLAEQREKCGDDPVAWYRCWRPTGTATRAANWSELASLGNSGCRLGQYLVHCVQVNNVSDLQAAFVKYSADLDAACDLMAENDPDFPVTLEASAKW